MSRIVVALGGNTLLQRGQGPIEYQGARIREAANHVAWMRDRGESVVLTHGNGPQVGNLLLQQERAGILDLPLDVLVAETQAQIGYPLGQELDNELGEPVVTLVTQVRVDADDPAFDEPTKPIGPFYAAGEAREKPFPTMEVRTPEGGRAHRRVVPSPRPREIVEAGRIRDLTGRGAVVIAAGGGGVPVVRRGGRLEGVEAVIDKDRSSALLASTVDADELVVLTDVDAAYVDFGGPDQRPIGAVDPATLRGYLDAGEFAEGSMKPKVEACIGFVEEGGGRAIITSVDAVERALDGEAGTRVTP